MSLPYELLSQIVVLLDTDLHSLYRCALVCKAFHTIATPLLYKRIHVSPPKTGIAWQILEDVPGRKPFATSRLPSHTQYVEEFKLDGYITRIRPSRQIPVPIVEKIPLALRMWLNLRKITITPKKVTGDGFRNIIATLKSCKSLKSLTINEFAMEEESLVSELVQLEGLDEIVLFGPTGALFRQINGWISSIQGTISTLNFVGNCGSLTPGILRCLTPCLSQVEEFAIGLSYSLTHADIFTCLSQLPKLRQLQVQYYRQHGQLPLDPKLLSLRSLIVVHFPLVYKEEACELSAWIRRVAASAQLENLQTSVNPGFSGTNLSFDGLITHLAHHHKRSLKVLSMPSAHTRASALQILLQNCGLLEEVALNITFNALKSFPSITNHSSCLHAISFTVCDHPDLFIDATKAKKVFERVPQLRCVTINHVTWKGEWILALQKNDSPEFIVSMIQCRAIGGATEDALV